MKKLYPIFIVLFSYSTTFYSQDTIPSCVWGLSINSGNTMITEYLDEDSVFITLWDSEGSLITPRTFSGYYNVSQDTVTFTQEENQQPCDTVPGVYVYTLDTSGDSDTLIVTLVNDPCSDRVLWHDSFSRVPCWASPVVSIEDKMLPSSFIKIYPNPASTQITIEGPSNQFTNETELVICNSIGKRILKKKIIMNSYGIFNLNVEYLPSGIYFIIVIQNNQELLTKKFVISR